MWLCQNCRKQSLYIGSAILGSWWSLLPSVLSLESKGYMLLAWSSLWVQGTYIGTGLQIESRQHRLEQHLLLGFALFKVRHSSQQVGGKNNGAKGTICCPLPVLGIISLWVTISINCLVQGPQAAPARANLTIWRQLLEVSWSRRRQWCASQWATLAPGCHCYHCYHCPQRNRHLLQGARSPEWNFCHYFCTNCRGNKVGSKSYVTAAELVQKKK